MDLEEIKAKLYDDFDAEGIVARQEKRRQEELKNAPAPLPQPVDIYQRNQVRIQDVNDKVYPRGSSPIVNLAVKSVIDGAGAEGLAHAYKRAKDDSDTLKARGEKGRAELRRRQYMDEYFLPAVEIVVNSASPDEALNSKQALDELDKYTLLEGSGKGYTATYIRQAYGNQLGQMEGQSDDSVRSGVQRLNFLLDDGQIRTAYGLASKLKNKIEKGDAMADEMDYDLICRIVAYNS